MEHLTTLSAIEYVRKRPVKGADIDDTTSNGLHQLINRLIEATIDPEYLNECKNLTVKIHLDGTFSLKDDGRGLPLLSNIKSDPRPMVERVLTSIFAGGNKYEDVYKRFGYLINLGCVVNALSEWLVLETVVENIKYKIRCERGEIVQNLHPTGQTNDKGTYIHLKPDSLIWTDTAISADVLKSSLEKLKLKWLTVHLILIDERAGKTFLFQ